MCVRSPACSIEREREWEDKNKRKSKRKSKKKVNILRYRKTINENGIDKSEVGPKYAPRTQTSYNE